MLYTERQFADYRVPKNLDDMEDVSAPYQAPVSGTGPDGYGGPPQDGAVLTWHTDRSAGDKYDGMAWFSPFTGAIGPVICNKYSGEGAQQWTDDDIFGTEDRNALWLITAMLDGGAGSIGTMHYIDVNDEGSCFIAADRTTTGEWTSFDHASVAFLWWPPIVDSSLWIEGGSHNADDTERTFDIIIRAVRLGDAPTNPEADCGCVGA
jgi:hypothetical protein